MKKTVLLAILDGLGESKSIDGNAVLTAHTPFLDDLNKKYPHTLIHADGQYVGLPKGQMGNSEVGHTNIGAGRVVRQSLERINYEIENGQYFKNSHLLKAIAAAEKSSLHIFGLLSDGGVHSHFNHIVKTIELAHEKKIKNIYIHAFLDGRDVAPNSGLKYLQQLNIICQKYNAKIATISGRYYAMDRDTRWDRVELAYNAIVLGQGANFTDPINYVEKSYNEKIYDEFVIPAVNHNVFQKINDGDSIIFINFRPDRARQLSAILTNDSYNPNPEKPIFKPKHKPKHLTFTTMMNYGSEVHPTYVIYEKEHLKNTLGEVLEKNGKTQLRIAETEKYPHVTYFFDSGIEQDFKGKKQILIPSPKVKTYDLKPEMSAYEITDSLLYEIKAEKYDVIILNLANPDMVGHSGKLKPTVKAVETVDICLAKIIPTLKEHGGVAIVTADHGNAELVTNLDGTPNTAHTTNLVNLIITDENIKIKHNSNNALCDIAPTILDLLDIQKPKEMTGTSLINKE